MRRVAAAAAVMALVLALLAVPTVRALDPMEVVGTASVPNGGDFDIGNGVIQANGAYSSTTCDWSPACVAKVRRMRACPATSGSRPSDHTHPFASTTVSEQRGGCFAHLRGPARHARRREQRWQYLLHGCFRGVCRLPVRKQGLCALLKGVAWLQSNHTCSLSTHSHSPSPRHSVRSALAKVALYPNSDDLPTRLGTTSLNTLNAASSAAYGNYLCVGMGHLVVGEKGIAIDMHLFWSSMHLSFVDRVILPPHPFSDPSLHTYI